MGAELLTVIAATTLVMVVPGPSVLYAVTTRLELGPLAGLAAIGGLETGLLAHVVAGTVGTAALLAALPGVLVAVQVAGSAYLLVLGVRQLRGRPLAGPTAGSGAAPTPSRRRLVAAYRGGVLVDLLNPKTLLFVVALLPAAAGTGAHAPAPLLVGGCVVAIASATDLAWLLLASRLPTGPVVVMRVRRLCGCGLIALAALALVT